jgi:hypothetical protein
MFQFYAIIKARVFMYVQSDSLTLPILSLLHRIPGFLCNNVIVIFTGNVNEPLFM